MTLLHVVVAIHEAWADRRVSILGIYDDPDAAQRACPGQGLRRDCFVVTVPLNEAGDWTISDYTLEVERSRGFPPFSIPRE